MILLGCAPKTLSRKVLATFHLKDFEHLFRWLMVMTPTTSCQFHKIGDPKTVQNRLLFKHLCCTGRLHGLLEPPIARNTQMMFSLLASPFIAESRSFRCGATHAKHAWNHFGCLRIKGFMSSIILGGCLFSLNNPSLSAGLTHKCLD